MTLQQFRPEGATGYGEARDFFYRSYVTGKKPMIPKECPYQRQALVEAEGAFYSAKKKQIRIDYNELISLISRMNSEIITRLLLTKI